MLSMKSDVGFKGRKEACWVGVLVFRVVGSNRVYINHMI